MECPREDDEVLSTFVDGEAPAGERRTVARHVLNCDKCAAETGRLLAVRTYLGTDPEHTAELSHGFWERLHQALRLTDEVASAPAKTKPRRRPSPMSVAVQPRVAWAVTAVSLFLAVMVLFTARTGPVTVAPATLAQTHQYVGGGFDSPSSLQPVGWSTPPPASGGGVWLPQLSWGPSPFSGKVEHESYQGAGLTVSRFRLLEGALNTAGMKHRRVGGVDYYAGQQGPTTILARREGAYWLVLAANIPADDLLEFAEQYGDLMR